METVLDWVGYYGLGAIACAFTMFVWEYVCLRKNTVYKPSVIMSFGVRWCRKGFEWIGWCLALVSSFYTLVDFEDLLLTARNLVRPIWQLACSPVWVAIGYVQRAELYKYPYLVSFGSITLIGLVIYLLDAQWVYDHTIVFYHKNVVMRFVEIPDDANTFENPWGLICLIYLAHLAVILICSGLAWDLVVYYCNKKNPKSPSILDKPIVKIVSDAAHDAIYFEELRKSFLQSKLADDTAEPFILETTVKRTADRRVTDTSEAILETTEKRKSDRRATDTSEAIGGHSVATEQDIPDIPFEGNTDADQTDTKNKNTRATVRKNEIRKLVVK